MPASTPDRLALVDAFKAVACLVIVLHHLAFYGPMAHRAAVLAPDLVAAFAQHGRLAVQVFLVVGGFLAARALAPRGRLVAVSPVRLLARRYARLAIPYFLAAALAVAGAWVARGLMDDPSVPASPSAAQLLAHALLLQDVLGFDSLAAGLWYVAIDFQLFVLLVAVLWLGARLGGARAGGEWLGPVLVAALGCVSLFFFNRVAALDAWAPYFFVSYAMGAIVYWITRSGRSAALWLIPLVLATLAALELHFRSRVAFALGVALVLAFGTRGWLPVAWAQGRAFRQLGSISYSVFLLHFPVCLVVTGLWVRLLPAGPWVQALGVLVAWSASVLAGWLFYRHVESRSAALAAHIVAAIAQRASAALLRATPTTERPSPAQRP